MPGQDETLLNFSQTYTFKCLLPGAILQPTVPGVHGHTPPDQPTVTPLHACLNFRNGLLLPERLQTRFGEFVKSRKGK